MVNGLHLYSAFIQSALQFLPLIHPFTHTFTHQRRLAAMQGTNQLVRSNWGLGVLLRDTSTRPGWDRTGNPPTARQQLYLLSHIAPRVTGNVMVLSCDNKMSVFVYVMCDGNRSMHVLLGYFVQKQQKNPIPELKRNLPQG